MEIGIIAEGKGDCAVLKNILMGLLDLDEEDIRFLRPDFNMDNTDKAAYESMPLSEFSTWTLVKKDCEEHNKFRSFLDNPIAGERYIIIQIDTAECEEKGYDIQRADKKNPDYCEQLRQAVKGKIDEWLQNKWADQIHYAICIEEMEAWIHTLYEKRNTSIPVKAKEAFQKCLAKHLKTNKKLARQFQKNQRTEFIKADFLSKKFRKKKELMKALEQNQSLKTFVLSF